jgi:hypothetical protein
VEEAADDPLLLPDATGHAGVQVTAEEVEAFRSSPEIDDARLLLRVKGQTEVTQESSCALWACSACARAEHNTTKSSA